VQSIARRNQLNLTKTKPDMLNKSKAYNKYKIWNLQHLASVDLMR